jgi:Kef-type K+ transport system membrane component KefB
VASTVVLLRALEHRGLLASVNGQIAVGWLVVEDLVMVLVLVLLPPLSGRLGGADGAAVRAVNGSLLTTLLTTVGEIALFVIVMLFVGRRVFPWLLWKVAGTGSRELFTLCVISAAVGIAYGSAELFGVSFALGAFFSGMIMRESPLSHRAAEDSLPLKDAFSVLFFVSVGMLFDPAVVVRQPLQLLAVVAIIILGKSLAAFLIVLAFAIRSTRRSRYRQTWRRSASSPSSWPDWGFPSASFRPPVRASSWRERSSRYRSTPWSSRPSSRRGPGSGRGPGLPACWSDPRIPWHSFLQRSNRGSSRATSCWSGMAASAG